jgi:hypothetical protein
MWVVSLLTIVLYVHLFNAISPMYHASDRTLTLSDLVFHVKRTLEAQAV